jgi:hypothetical protein
MAYIKQNTVEIGTITLGIVQEIAAGNEFDGTAPALVADTFVTYVDQDTGVYHYASPSSSAVVKGDAGGLFSFTQAGPGSIEGIMCDFGDTVTWSLSIMDSYSHEVVIANGSSRYLIRREYDRIYFFPGDSIKLVTTGAAEDMWARLAVTLAQGTH